MYKLHKWIISSHFNYNHINPMLALWLKWILVKSNFLKSVCSVLHLKCSVFCFLCSVFCVLCSVFCVVMFCVLYSDVYCVLCSVFMWSCFLGSIFCLLWSSSSLHDHLLTLRLEQRCQALTQPQDLVRNFRCLFLQVSRIFLPLDWGKVICPKHPHSHLKLELIVQGVKETKIRN